MKKKKTYDYARFGYIFSIPFMVTWLIFQFYPICYTFLIGFTDLKGAGNTEFNILWSKPFANFASVLGNEINQGDFKVEGGVYARNGKVVYRSYNTTYWHNTFYCAYRIFGS